MNHLERYGGTRDLFRAFSGVHDAEAARDFHVYYGERCRAARFEDGGEPLDMRIEIVELRAGHCDSMPRKVFPVKVRQGHRGAVGEQNNVGAQKEAGSASGRAGN